MKTLRISSLITNLDADKHELYEKAAKRLNISTEEILGLTIIKKSIDDKSMDNICFKYIIDVTIASDSTYMLKHIDKDISFPKTIEYTPTILKHKKKHKRPVVVGSGPAGLFCALTLSYAGLRPIIIEKGMEITQRDFHVKQFTDKSILNENSNIQFGEGGAGTYSDGKLKVGMMTPVKYKVLNEFVRSGAEPDILYLSKPHIGTDKLKNILINLRKQILSLGGEYRFNTSMNEILFKDNQVLSIMVKNQDKISKIITDTVILATGHSARTTFSYLYSIGIPMKSKPFGIGLRIEHPQAYINKIRYKNFHENPNIIPADYHLVTHLSSSRSVYSFCMCPGGYVIPATSEEGCVVTNGMSMHSRSGVNANSALLVSVTESDFKSCHPLAGMELQRKIEMLAYNAAGRTYCAGVQRLEDFMMDRNSSKFNDVLPTYRPSTVFLKSDEYLPHYITDSIRMAINDMDQWLEGFYYPDALLTGPETRSTSPVVLLRDNNMQCISRKGLFFCGEGSGYTGGILSSAADGVNCADSILNMMNP
ncbi:MAG TPA: FAD-binding protein [Clostridia bacterium]|nr:FAD-binding protein [Clostridia bacterium]